MREHRTRRAAVATLLVAGALLFSETTVSAGDNPSLTVEIAPTSGPGGTVIDVSGECFEDATGACDAVEILLLDPDGIIVGQFTIDENVPDYAGQVTVPEDAVCSVYTVRVRGLEGELGVIIAEDVPFQVTTDCPPPPTDDTIPTEPSTAATGATRPTFTG